MVVKQRKVCSRALYPDVSWQKTATTAIFSDQCFSPRKFHPLSETILFMHCASQCEFTVHTFHSLTTI